MRLTFARRDDATSPVAATLPAPHGVPSPPQDQRALAARVVELMREPLARTTAAVDALLGDDHGPLAAGVRDRLDGVAEDARALAKAVADLDAVVQLRPHDTGDVRLMVAADWLARAVDRHRKRAEGRGVQLELRTADPGLLVRGVPDDLDGALDQLLDNAILATRPGGAIAVDAASGGWRLLVRVEDDGIGFDADEAAGLTACFARTRAAVAAGLPGLGVGMFLADRIARQHGGQVTLHGEPGLGATAWLELPQA